MSAFTGLCRAVVVVAVVGAGTASAEVAARKAAAGPARVAAKAAKKPVPRRPIVTDEPSSAPVAMSTVATPDLVLATPTPNIPATAPTQTALLVAYQRIGRELMLLKQSHGTECTLDLWPQFKSIKLDAATATPEARLEAAITLAEIQLRIERKKGITLRQECLNNPLAPECM